MYSLIQTKFSPNTLAKCYNIFYRISALRNMSYFLSQEFIKVNIISIVFNGIFFKGADKIDSALEE